jgi:hypothetical protein
MSYILYSGCVFNSSRYQKLTIKLQTNSVITQQKKFNITVRYIYMVKKKSFWTKKGTFFVCYSSEFRTVITEFDCRYFTKIRSYVLGVIQIVRDTQRGGGQRNVTQSFFAF